jgi:hypothetical protein
MNDGKRILVDGGIVSSIPAWLYRRHRTLDPDARILAIGIAAADYETWIPYFLAARTWKETSWSRRWHAGWLAKAFILLGQLTASTIWPLRVLANIGSTTAYGARALELDASDRLDTFDLHPHVGLLDFDMRQEDVKDEVDRLKKEARFFVDSILWGRKEAFAETCETIALEFWKRAWEWGKAEEEDLDDSARIRMFWAERDGPVHAVRIKATYGFNEDDLDDRLVLSYRSSMSGWAAETNRSQFGDKSVLDAMLKSWKNRYRIKVKWPELRWCWAIPVSDPNGKLKGIFAIESNRDMAFFDRNLVEQSQDRARAWNDAGDPQTLRSGEAAIAATDEARTRAEKMVSLEQTWAQFVWINYAGSSRFAETPPPESEGDEYAKAG